MTLKPNNLHVYNTLTRRREKFEPLAPPHVGVYVCGPTVYGDAHLGHAKSYISFDVIVRYLRHLGYDVTYVQNITDVGHLTDDADSGEDKVEKAARAKKVHPMQIAEQFTRRYFEDMDALNVLSPDISPRASGHIIEQIELVKRLLASGHAYEANGSVYFDVASWPAYGRLSGRSVEEMQAGARVEVSAEKRHPADFALWKRAEPGHIMQWHSPWGVGYPGWHIECTVMGQKYLGETLDIHGGGIENAFPHHEDEIAQAEAATGKPFVKYWLHNNMVTVGGQKMGKSLGNFLTLRDAFEKWDPMVIRLFILQSHYRSPTDFSEQALEAAKEGWNKIYRTVKDFFEKSIGTEEGPISEMIATSVDESRVRFCQAMDDDFNTSVAVAEVFDLARKANRLMDDKSCNLTERATVMVALNELAWRVLGLALPYPGAFRSLLNDVRISEYDRAVSVATKAVSLTEKAVSLLRDMTGSMRPRSPLMEGSLDLAEESVDRLGRVIHIIIDLRNDARAAKNFAQADAIRKRLDEIGIVLEDTPDGTKWRFK